tara:strand:- start:9743 stop:10543 length:801 start_codon:yes stop_codon:yes gene_type:complete
MISPILQGGLLYNVKNFNLSISLALFVLCTQFFSFFYYSKDIIKRGFLTRFCVALFSYVMPIIGFFIFLKHAMNKKVQLKKDIINGFILNLILIASFNISAPEKVFLNSSTYLLNYQSSFYLNVPRSTDTIVNFFQNDELKKCNLSHKCEIIKIEEFIKSKKINFETIPMLMSFHFLYRFNHLKNKNLSKELFYNSLLNVLNYYEEYLSSNKGIPGFSILPLVNPFLSLELSIVAITRHILFKEIQQKIVQKIESFTQSMSQQLKN